MRKKPPSTNQKRASDLPQRKTDPGSNLGEAVREAFLAGLRGDPSPLSWEEALDDINHAVEQSQEEWENAYLDEWTHTAEDTRHNRYDAIRDMKLQATLFVEDHDPIALLRCVVTVMNLNTTPPKPIREALKEKFQRVLDGQGHVKLDKELGLKDTKQGGRTAWTKNQTRNEQFWLASNMFGLNKGFGLSLEAAADKLAVFLETHQGAIKPHSAETLVREYSRRWKKRFHFETITPTDWRHPQSWPPAFRARFMKQYQL